MEARMAPAAQRRRLFDAPWDRSRLVQDTVLLSLEVRIPHESMTAAALMDWVGEAGFGDGPEREKEVEWAKIACDCQQAMLLDGRGARVELLDGRSGNAQQSQPQADDGCCAIVRLSNGASCRVYPEEMARPDGAIAVLTPPGRIGLLDEILEIRYRSDESVEVSLSGGSRVVKHPRRGLLFHEALSGERHVRQSESTGFCHESANGSVAEVWIDGNAASTAALTPRVVSPCVSTSTPRGSTITASMAGPSSSRRCGREHARALQNTAVVRTVLGTRRTSMRETELAPEALLDQHVTPELMRRQSWRRPPRSKPSLALFRSVQPVQT